VYLGIYYLDSATPTALETTNDTHELNRASENKASGAIFSSSHHALAPHYLLSLHMPCRLPAITPLPAHEPVHRDDKHHDAVHGGHVVHGASGHRLIVREAVHDDGEQRPGEQDDEEADYGDGVGDVEEDDAGRDHSRVGKSASIPQGDCCGQVLRDGGWVGEKEGNKGIRGQLTS